MSALTILIIRHAEKPERSWPGPGLTPAGAPDAQSLVIRGWQRAGAWAALFGTGLGGQDYPLPSMIYAADPNATPDDEPDDEPSQRPFETVIPLAARLGKKPPDTTFAVRAGNPTSHHGGRSNRCGDHRLGTQGHSTDTLTSHLQALTSIP